MQETNLESAAEQTLQYRLEELQKRATKDDLSGLLNRVTAEQYITRRLEEMRPEDCCAMFIVDLDDFKAVNDTLGHQAGDQAIRRSAKILSSIFYAKDIVGRLGGDEFIAFMSGCVTEEAVRQRGAAICEDLQLVLGGNSVVTLTASVGIYLSRGEKQSFDNLYQSADLALYKAKKAGKKQFCLKRGQEAPASGENFRPVNTIPLTGLLEYMDSGVALLEMEDPIQISYVSPSFCRILGVDAKSYVTPRQLSGLVHPDDLLEWERVLRGGVRGNRAVEHTHRVSVNGEAWHWWRARAIRVNDSSPYPVMLVTTTDISRFKENERRLEDINQRLKIALDQTTQSLWEVDLESGNFLLFDRAGVAIADEEGQKQFPGWLLENGWIHPDSVPRFKEFAADLLSGQVQGFGTFVVLNRKTGRYGWKAISYRMAEDGHGQPTRAVGIVENLPQNFVAQETASVLQRPLPEALRPDLILAMRANLSQDMVQDLWYAGKGRNAEMRDAACAAYLQKIEEAVFSEDDRSRCAGYFASQALLRRFQEGERWLCAEYRWVDDSGEIHWASHIANLVEDPLTREVYLFLYITRLDHRRALERAVRDKLLRDSVTRLYSKASLRLIADALLPRSGAGNCAVALLDLGGLSQRYAADRAALDRGLFYLACAFRVALGTGCLLARYSADQFQLFFPSAASRQELRNQLEGAFSFVRLVLAGSMEVDGVRFVAGAVLEPARSANISAMTVQADSLCQLWRNAAADTVAFPHEGDGGNWLGLKDLDDRDKVSVHSTEMDRPLSDGEKEVAFHCMSAMLSSDTLETSVRGVLSYIGEYYHADRAYVLTLAANGPVVTMPYEWTGGQKHSIQHAMSGARIDRFPLLQRCIEERAPVFLSREGAAAAKGKTGVEPWYFTVFPLIDREILLGFLCIENAREHPADAALFSILIPYLLRERERYQARPASGRREPVASPLDLPNLRSYMEVIYTLNSSQYSSMGAVCLDIPNLSAINSSLGFEYGSRLLWYVSKTLADIFGAGWIFRTWDTEFVAICPNTTQQVFLGRCRRLRSILQRRYPREFRMGCTWSGGTFQAKELVSEAKDILLGDRVGAAADTEDFVLAHGRYHSVGEAAREGRFTVYLQPQVDMGTGRLFGAEVLVRGIGDDGTVILPGAFIPELEKSGNIKDLDLFVLEQTLSLMDRWRLQGLEVVPVSVNLSRVTLFSPTALASVLAIQSRYPNVPPEALELEITESAGDVETGTLQAVIDQFRQCGLRFGLDDFGSKYANLPIFTNVKFDTVKLDRRLISDLADNPINRMLVQDIIQICQARGMSCIAEGVETRDQAAVLMETGCHYAQGYYYDRPMPAEQFEEKYLRCNGGAAAEQDG